MYCCHCLSPSFSMLMLLATAPCCNVLNLEMPPDLDFLQYLRPLSGDTGDPTMAAHQNPESKYNSNSPIGRCNGVNYSFDYTCGCCSRVDPDATSKKSILSRSGNLTSITKWSMEMEEIQGLASSVVKWRAFESKSGTAEAGTSRFYVQAYTFTKDCGNAVELVSVWDLVSARSVMVTGSQSRV